MHAVQNAPPGANTHRPTLPLALDLADPQAVRRWLAAARTQLLDCADAGEDATLPPGKRMLGRSEARRQLVEARDSLLALLLELERGLPAAAGEETAQ